MRGHLSNFDRAARGLTLMELMVGLVITSVAMLALSTFVSAVSNGWTHANSTATTAVTVDRTSSQVDSVLRNSLAIVQKKLPTSSSKSSYLFVWRYDGAGGIQDGVAAVGEMNLLEFDPTTYTIWLYAPYAESAMSASQLIDAYTTNWGDLSSPTVAEAFKTRSCVAPRRAIVGPGSATATTVSRVLSGYFDCRTNSGGSTVALYNFSLVPGNATTPASSLYGGITTRNPLWPTNATTVP
ncbi:MAG: prepilin-type N-terminal cleavage/methylation domain-containing protein [Tepidisphaeraceae bacterium]